MNNRLILWVVVLSIQASALAAILTVPSDYPTIQGAIDAAWPGDGIEVLPGTYLESIDFLGKDIILVGASGPGSTIIDATGLGRPVIFQSGESSSAVLTGFTICNGS